MPNYINHEAPSNMARMYARKVKSQEGQRWFNTVVRNWLRNSPDCAVPMDHLEDEGSFEEWVVRAIREGMHVHWFHANEATVEKLNMVVHWIRSLEQVRSKRSPENLVNEARRHLGRLQHCGFQQALQLAEQWSEQLGQINEQNDEQKLNQEIFSTKKITSFDGRIWKRITTLGELNRTGRDLCNCLRHHYWDSAFADRQMEFWGLLDEDSTFLAALRISHLTERSPMAVEFKEKHNVVATRYRNDFLKLNKKLQLDTGEDEDSGGDNFLAMGILDGRDTQEDNRPSRCSGTDIFWYGNDRVLLRHSKHGDHIIDLYKHRNLAEALDSCHPDLIPLAGRCLAKLKNNDRDEHDWEFDDVILKGNHYRYWRDAILRTWRYGGKRYIETPEGVTQDGLSPRWILRNNGDNGMLIARPDKAEGERVASPHVNSRAFIESIEQSKYPLTFWRKLDEQAEKVSSLSDMAKDEDGRPILWCAPTLEGWRGPHKGWREAQYKDLNVVPDKEGKNCTVQVREREVLDWRLNQSKGDCKFRNHLNDQKQPYAFQLVAHVRRANGENIVEAGGVLRVTSVRKHEFHLSAPGRHPEALAHLLKVVWAPRYYKLSYAPEDESRFRCLVTERKDGYHPILPEERIDGIGGWKKYRNTFIGYDTNDLIVWSANDRQMVLQAPSFWISEEEAVTHALRVAQHLGLRFSGEWSQPFASQGYYLDAGAPVLVPEPTLRLLAIGQGYDGACARRDIQSGRFNWVITCTGGVVFRLAHDQDEPFCTLECEEDHEESDTMPDEARVLIHALLDRFGMTLSPSDLRLVGLQRFNNGHIPAYRFSTIPIEGSNAYWQAEDLRWGPGWVLNVDGETAAEVCNDKIIVNISECPDSLFPTLLRSVKQAFADAVRNEELPEYERRPWEERFGQVLVGEGAWEYSSYEDSCKHDDDDYRRDDDDEKNEDDDDEDEEEVDEEDIFEDLSDA